MRDPKRIDKFCDEFEEFEKECPEYYEKIVEKLRIENEKHKVSELYDY